MEDMDKESPWTEKHRRSTWKVNILKYIPYGRRFFLFLLLPMLSFYIFFYYDDLGIIEQILTFKIKLELVLYLLVVCPIMALLSFGAIQRWFVPTASPSPYILVLIAIYMLSTIISSIMGEYAQALNKNSLYEALEKDPRGKEVIDEWRRV
jgi:hypothetical protein